MGLYIFQDSAGGWQIDATTGAHENLRYLARNAPVFYDSETAQEAMANMQRWHKTNRWVIRCSERNGDAIGKIIAFTWRGDIAAGIDRAKRDAKALNKDCYGFEALPAA